MDKADKRSIMYSLGYLKLTDKQVLSFIKNLADSQRFKMSRPYELFCIDCAILCTSTMPVMLKKMKVLSDDEYHDWSEQFIERCRSFKLNKGD